MIRVRIPGTGISDRVNPDADPINELATAILELWRVVLVIFLQA